MTLSRSLSRPLARLGLALAAGAVTIGLVGPATAATDAPSRTTSPDVTAHRGSSGVAPENTLAAISVALRQRSDVVENDIQRTSDGELVIMHDTSLARTTNVEELFPDRAPWNVGDFTLAEIKQLDAGSWFAPEFAGERVPTLAEWGRAIGGRAGMLLEPKSPALYPGVEVDLDDELRSVKVFRQAVQQGRLVVQSFDHVWLRGYKQIAPEVPVGLLFGARPTQADITGAAVWAQQVNPALGVIQESDITAIHDAGMEAHVWTVNDGAGMRRAINWRADGIITNYPQVLRDILSQR
ncbi:MULTISPECIES: glycerophosphodiester phosphodiesterase [unclassified Nocardioides]|uniref:glycerophosphodiester phosphodiesterase n=1 Tax=unclassified Nocardioides TaxID=2615069 RepID=UPI003620FF1F